MDWSDETSASAVTRQLERAHTLLCGGRVRDSAQIAQALVDRHPTNPAIWHLLSCIYLQVGQHIRADGCAMQALSFAPTELTFLIQRGNCLIAMGRRREALEMATTASEGVLDRPELNDALGTLLTYCDEPLRALPFFQRAVQQIQNRADFLFNLATAQRMTGDIAGAETTLKQVVALRPSDGHAHFVLASLRTQSPLSNHVEELTRLLANPIATPQQEIPLRFALAKELEDIEDFRHSFTHLKRACDLHRRQINYNVADDVALLDRFIEAYDRSAVNVAGTFETPECLFVIGLPRTGTTLIERILASHSQVFGAGELQALPQTVQKLIATRFGQQSLNAQRFVEYTLALSPDTLGRQYVEATRPQTGGTPHFVDKLPTNYLYAGLIRRALPRARIVAVTRDPLDSCYAMYKTFFNNAYSFSYDLGELAQYYLAWHRLMCHWRDVLGESLLIVQYEDLVTHQETTTRKILRHCGLPWEDACLRFHERSGRVTTASATQVRQPLYASSIGKWRHYAAELRPLVETLKAHEPAAGWRLSDP